MLNENERIGIVACSNPLNISNKENLISLLDMLLDMKINPVLSKMLFPSNLDAKTAAKKKGKIVNDFYKDEDIKAIFDISGGDLANTILPYLDYAAIKAHPKPFFGYSDVTSIINAIYAKTGNLGYLYQLKNIYFDEGHKQLHRFKETMIAKSEDLYDIKWDFIQGEMAQGIMVGGNIRCFLKLAGTPYFPDLTGKILFLESFGGSLLLMESFLAQLQQLPCFTKIKALALGTFTKIDEADETNDLIKMVLNTLDDINLPIIKTKEVGHGLDAKCLIIGKEYKIVKA